MPAHNAITQTQGPGRAPCPQASMRTSQPIHASFRGSPQWNRSKTRRRELLRADRALLRWVQWMRSDHIRSNSSTWNMGLCPYHFVAFGRPVSESFALFRRLVQSLLSRMHRSPSLMLLFIGRYCARRMRYGHIPQLGMVSDTRRCFES